MATIATNIEILGQAFFGMLPEDAKKRLTAVIINTNDDTWDAAHSIILNAAEKLTLWQAVCIVDPDFPQDGPKYDIKGTRLEPWPQIPSERALAAALLHAIPARPHVH